MNLVNGTRMLAGYTVAVQPDGRELLVVVVKGTFRIPGRAEEPSLADDQVPLVMTDQFCGEPAMSAPLYEVDFAPRKPYCDVLLIGSAYAPRGEPSRRVPVTLQVGGWSKSFDVVGNRHWQPGAFDVEASVPEPFVVMPISYANAFGGIDRAENESESDDYYLENHVGVGYHPRGGVDRIVGRRLPNTEERGKAIDTPNGDYAPMSFGPIGRAWRQRIRYAGTYDDEWLSKVFPYLPADFREEYYQAAPASQWIDFPSGGEQVLMRNLTPQGVTAFKLPVMTVAVVFERTNGARTRLQCQVDTLLFEPDAERFTITSRCALPLKRNIHEMREAVVVTSQSRYLAS